MDLRKICDSVDEQGWVKVAIKVTNDKVDEAKTVLDQLGYTAYDIERSGDDDKVIKVSTQHPDETKAKLLPKLKEAGITPISTRVTDSNKRLDEYILGSLRANGIESAVNVEQYKDGFRVSLQGNTDVYLDIYLDGENVVVRGFDPDAVVNATRYATFAGIPAEQAKQVIRKFEKWANKVAKLDAHPVAELESVRVTDGLNIPAYSKKYIEDALWSALGLRVKVATEDGRITIAIPNTPVGAGGYVVVAEVVPAGKSLKVMRGKDASKYKGNASIVSAVIDEAKEYFKSHPDFPFHVTDSVSIGDVIYAVIRDTGATGLITAERENGAVRISLAGSKEPLARVKKREEGSYGVYLIAKREELTAKQEEFIDALAEALAANHITDSVEDLKLPKFSSNAKLNKLCTYLAEAAIEKYDTLDAAIEELENYKDRFSDDLGYGYIQNGNIHSLVSDDDALAYLHDAGYATKMSGDAAWDAVCRTMGQVIRTLLEHKDELLKQKVTDDAGAVSKMRDWLNSHTGDEAMTVIHGLINYYKQDHNEDVLVRANEKFGENLQRFSAILYMEDSDLAESILKYIISILDESAVKDVYEYCIEFAKAPRVTDEGWGHGQRGAGFITPEIAADAARRIPVEGVRTEIVGASKNFPAEVHVYEDGAPEFSAPQVVISLDEDTHKIQVSLVGGDGTSNKVMDTIYKLLYDDLQGKIGLPEVWRAAKGKVYDGISSRARFLDGNDYIEVEDIVKRHYPNATVNAYKGNAGEVSVKVQIGGNRISDVYGDFELTFDGRVIRKHGEDKLREMGDFDAMVKDLVANNPFKQYEAEIREKMNDTTRVYDSAKIKSASLRAALKKAGKLRDSAESESIVQSAIDSAKLKVPAKMRAALMRLANRKTPIERVEFKQERIASNVHDKDAYDYADVFYYHTSANKHATVSWDGMVHNAMS